MELRKDADYIVTESIKQVMPDSAVFRALEGKEFGPGKLFVVAAGKAAWQMAKTAEEVLGDCITAGVVCTKYDHVKAEIPRITCYEGGHPVPDENSVKATKAALDMVSNLNGDDTVIFLLSGGGSALFEVPLIELEELADITRQLLASGADITEINTIRKRLSAVKGGRFAKICEPARVFSIVLSDIIGNPLDMIGSGPAYPDTSTSEQALGIVEKYQLKLSEEVLGLLRQETPKKLTNVETVINGSVENICNAAKEICEELGYKTMILTNQMDCQAKEAGFFLASVARTYQNSKESLAFIAGGETVVQLIGNGLGGRNQELVLAAAEGISGLANTAVFSFGSDGTDGPTDAAGGYSDGKTKERLLKNGTDVFTVLRKNDAYHALLQTDGLIITGATGTNVNDVAVVLIKR